MPESKYLSEPGVKLVNRYAELKAKKKEFNEDIDSELEKVEEALYSFAEREGIDVIFGSKNKVRIKETETIRFLYKNSKERVGLEKLLKENGIWENVNQLDTAALNKILSDEKIDEKFIGKIKKFIKLENSKAFMLSYPILLRVAICLFVKIFDLKIGQIAKIGQGTSSSNFLTPGIWKIP